MSYATISPVREGGSMSKSGPRSVAQSAVLVPVVMWLHSPERAQGPFTNLYNWLQRRGRRIAAIVTLVIGLFSVG